MKAKHGLSEGVVGKIRMVLAGFPQVERAVLYGSRAKGNFRTGSDIDLTLFGDSLDFRTMARLSTALDDLLLPYTIDLSSFADLRHAELIDHIRRVGIVLYERESAPVAQCP